MSRQTEQNNVFHTPSRNSFEPEMVYVPAGSFVMGTSDAQVQEMLSRFAWAREYQKKGWFAREQPQHELTLPAYEIGRYPVTNAQYAAFVAATNHNPPKYWNDIHFSDELSGHPVVYVTWLDAMAYVKWLKAQTDKPYRLPTEAEWEKAARGDDGRLWPWGNEWNPECANWRPGDSGETTPVGQYSPAGGDSPYGCADMAGNVWEWCSSLWGSDPDKPSFGYPFRSDDERENPEAGGQRIVRGGGSWYTNDPGLLRCAYRGGNIPYHGGIIFGFRVAKNSPAMAPA
ncbi:MAG: formylglycine-generating enzyme family protein [Anaerolineae bacterium]|nr:formylglycine-generating enzyme family protein [Anaerolineae bacterium]